MTDWCQLNVCFVKKLLSVFYCSTYLLTLDGCSLKKPARNTTQITTGFDYLGDVYVSHKLTALFVPFAWHRLAIAGTFAHLISQGVIKRA